MKPQIKFYVGFLGIKQNDQLIIPKNQATYRILICNEEYNHIGIDAITSEIFNLYNMEDFLASLFICKASMPDNIPIILEITEFDYDDFPLQIKQNINKNLDENISILNKRIKDENTGKIIAIHKYVQKRYYNDEE